MFVGRPQLWYTFAPSQPHPELTAMHNQEATAAPRAEIITVRPSAEELSRQQLPYFVGISQESAGATGISVNMIVIPPGGAAQPHIHRGYETAIYILEGRVQTFYGPQLSQSTINVTGDFLFIPADLPHQPVNLSDSQPAWAIVARNDANEQESVVVYDPGAAAGGPSDR